MKTTLAVTLVVLLGVVGLPPAEASASGAIPAPSGLTSTEVSFTGFGGLTLHGTVLAPAKTTGTPWAGVVLVTGSGAGVPREHLLPRPRSSRGTASRPDLRQEVSRLHALPPLVLRARRRRAGGHRCAACPTRRRPREGRRLGAERGRLGRTAAASRSSEVAFVIVVGGNAMTPIRQQLWSETSSLRRVGVSGSLINHGKRNFTRLGADAGLFAEAYLDAQDILTGFASRCSAYGAAVTCRPRPRTTRRCSPRLSGGAATPITRSVSSPAPTTPRTKAPTAAPPGTGAGTRVRRPGRLMGPRRHTETSPTPTPRHRPSRTTRAPRHRRQRGGSRPRCSSQCCVLLVVAFTAYPLVAFIVQLRGRRVHPVEPMGSRARGSGIHLRNQPPCATCSI